MHRVRVLAVDDSAVIRRILREAFSSDEQMELVGVASNGRLALAMLDQCRPDAITLDIAMPEMDGLETLAALRARGSRIPVIMFSTLTERGAEATVEALSRGASDYVTKPTRAAGFEAAAEQVRKELLPKIKGLCGLSRRPAAPVLRLSGSSVQFMRSQAASPEVVVIGASTGGPNALAQVLSSIPSDFPIPILVVQHMPPLFTRFLAERLNKVCQVSVREGIAGEPLVAGRVLIAPGDYHMGVAKTGELMRVVTDKGPPENSCRPSVDVLFRSVAQAFRGRVLAVVLTGMGQDGLLGSQMIRECGGEVLAQDEASSVVWGMPGFVVKAGVANLILSLDAIGAEIVRAVCLKANRPVGIPR